MLVLLRAPVVLSQTRIAKSGVDPSFGDAFVVPCQGPRDAVVIGVYGGVGLSSGVGAGVGHVDETMLVGELPQCYVMSCYVMSCYVMYGGVRL